MPAFLTTPQGRQIAYHRTSARVPNQAGVVFLGGFMSSMEGTKALFLQEWAEREGRAFLRFDYSGHGSSSGAFVDGTIGTWLEDALAVIEAQSEGPLILVGSSMGGWMALLLAKKLGARVVGLVGIAAAPDFTEDLIWEIGTESQRRQLIEEGQVLHKVEGSAPEYEPYTITLRLIEEGRRHLVLRAPLPLPFPVRLLHGTADLDVPLEVATRLLAHAQGEDVRLTIVKGADHSFSSPQCLDLIAAQIEEVGRAAGLERLS